MKTCHWFFNQENNKTEQWSLPLETHWRSQFRIQDKMYIIPNSTTMHYQTVLHVFNLMLKLIVSHIVKIYLISYINSVRRMLIFLSTSLQLKNYNMLLSQFITWNLFFIDMIEFQTKYNQLMDKKLILV